jgi:predicted metalloprotease with PDZ domain
MSTDIHYAVTVADPAAHLFQVRLRIARPDPAGQRLTLPAWIPGSYMIRDFARNIVELDAWHAGALLPSHKLDKQTWQLAPASGAVEVAYSVYAWDLSVRAAYLDQTRAYFNGTSLLLRVVGQESLPHQMSIALPSEDPYRGWRVATTLPGVQIDERGLGLYQAPDYAALIDHPVEIGTHSSLSFAAAGAPHEMVIAGRHACDHVRLGADLERICSEHARMFGELPVQRYLFMTMATGDGYGGLEHRDSTSLMCARDDLPRPDMDEPDEGYRRFLGLCSHEYFHLWNVKRIRPERLKQADLSSEVHTELLWAFEGITSYYDELALARAGCITPKSFLALFAQTITRVQRGSGRRKQSVAESSFDAWTKFYKQDENAPNAIVSYYTKGALVAFGLDMLLRDASRDQVSLDDLMRALWQRYGKVDIGVPEHGIAELANELAGRDVSEFFSRYVNGTAELPLADWLRSVGVGMVLRPATDIKDQGTAADAAPDAGDPRPALGARWTAENGLARLTHVFDGGMAQAAGLSAGDRIIAVDHLQVTPDTLAKRIAQAPIDKTLAVHAFRRDELLRFDLRVHAPPADTATLWLLPDDQLTPAQLARRRAWLGQRDGA